MFLVFSVPKNSIEAPRLLGAEAWEDSEIVVTPPSYSPLVYDVESEIY